jgi:hypothetical protein
MGPQRMCRAPVRGLLPVPKAYAPWLANARRLRDLAAELEALSLAKMA